MLCVLKTLKPSADKIKIGFEATGHYTTNLKLFLEENQFDYMEFNCYVHIIKDKKQCNKTFKP